MMCPRPRLGVLRAATPLCELRAPRCLRAALPKLLPYRLSPNGDEVTGLLRRLALPPSVKHWSLATLRDKLIKIRAKVVHHARYVTFQLAEVALPRRLYWAIFERIRWFAALSAKAALI